MANVVSLENRLYDLDAYRFSGGTLPLSAVPPRAAIAERDRHPLIQMAPHQGTKAIGLSLFPLVLCAQFPLAEDALPTRDLRP